MTLISRSIKWFRHVSTRTKIIIAILLFAVVGTVARSGEPNGAELTSTLSTSVVRTTSASEPSTSEVSASTAEDSTQAPGVDIAETAATTNSSSPTTQANITTSLPSSGSGSLLDSLIVRDDPPIDGYSRSAWSHWNDINGSGCNTREDVLKAQVIGLPQYDPFDSSRCTIVEGDWYSVYDGVFYSGSPSELDIDHIVALSAAWRSGASTWNAAQRKAFANDPRNLVAVTASSNRSKSDDDVGDWRPIRSAWCATARAIIQVKAIYNLSVDPGERDALRAMESTCGNADQVPFGGYPVGGSTTVAPTTTEGLSGPDSSQGSPQLANPGDAKNCGDFNSYLEAKAWFDLYYPLYGDVARLDRDADGQPCESLAGGPG